MKNELRIFAPAKSAMREVFSKYGYLLDPHGAIACLGLQSFLTKHPSSSVKGIFLETAHPAKFANDVEKITDQRVPIPARLQEVFLKEKQSIPLSTNYEDLLNLLLKG